MSIWVDIPKDDITLSDDKKEIHILYKSDLQGNYYVSILVKDILEAINENNKCQK